MKQISDLLKDVKIPKMYKIRELYDATNIPAEDVPGIVTAELSRELIAEKIKPGMRIAITCGSRGIHHYPIFARAIVDFVRSRGAEPFIVAAMGSHGGATSEGQREILASNGITEEAMGCPVRTEMDSVEVGRSKISGGPVVCDKNAAEADGIILFNRIKPHTSFRGRYESGMLKMMAIGLGKQVGAENIHHQSPAIMGDLIAEYGRTILEATPVIGGIAIIENAYDETYLIRGLAREEILEEEPKLRDLSYEKFGKLLFDETDCHSNLTYVVDLSIKHCTCLMFLNSLRNYNELAVLHIADCTNNTSGSNIKSKNNLLINLLQTRHTLVPSILIM